MRFGFGSSRRDGYIGKDYPPPLMNSINPGKRVESEDGERERKRPALLGKEVILSLRIGRRRMNLCRWVISGADIAK